MLRAGRWATQVGETRRAGPRPGTGCGKPCGAVGWSYWGQRFVASDKPSGGVYAKSGRGAPRRGPDRCCATRRCRGHRGADSAGRATAHGDRGEWQAAQLTTTLAMWARRHGRPKCAREVVATGARESRQVGPGLGQQQRMWRRCHKRASTSGLRASQGKRSGARILVLSGSSRCSRPETWEDVPASGGARGIEPCSPDGGSSGTSAGPWREVVEGSSHCSPEAQLRTWEDSDSHPRRRTGYALGMMA